ncbi:hypothetical protein RCC89_09940 [Cytophagaceae bacterium ABcell3]|nr:hypothetical protein RCC89_09940 [Cytophagaceae bacterium ABcell3]
MKFVQLLFLGLIFFSNAVYAQVTHSIPLDKKSKLLDVSYLGSGDIILKTGRDLDFLKDRNIRITYMEGGLQEKWQVRLSPYRQKGKYEEYLVSSKDGEMVYLLTISGHQPFNEKSIVRLAQINDKGELQEHLLDDLPKGYLQTIYCDNDFLYLIATEKDLQHRKKKRGEEKIIINRYAHNGFSFGAFNAQLPKLEDPENASFWELAGNSKDTLYFLSKHIAERCHFNFAKVSQDGTLLGEQNIEVPLKSDFLMPSHNLKDLAGGAIVNSNDFRTFLTGTSNGEKDDDVDQHINNVHVIHENGAYGGLKLYPDKNALYIYGLYGPNRYRAVGNIHEGFFVSKFDMNGNLVFNKQFQMPEEVIDDSFFRIMATPFQRGTFLDVLDHQIVFRLWYKNEAHNIILDEKGEVKNYYTSSTKNSLFNEQFFSFNPSEKTHAGQFVEQLDNSYVRKNKVVYRKSFEGDLIIREDIKGQEVEFLLFK